MADRKPVVFFHVMNCGGTSVRRGLALGVARERTGAGVFELDGQAAIEAVGGNDKQNWEFRDSLLSYVLDTMSPTIVLGHFRFCDRHARHLDDAHFVTVLRAPVDRYLSLYKYRRYKEGVHVPVAGSFADVVETRRFRSEGHAIVGAFCGRADLDPHSDEAIDAAVRNLGRFAAIGFIDRLDDFAADVSVLVGRKVTIPRMNASPAPADLDDLGADPELMDRVREICAPDQQVFDRVAGATGGA